MRPVPPAVALLVALAIPPQGVGAQASDVVRGTIRSDSGRVVAGATVIVTRSSDRAVQQTLSDSGGRWRIEIADGSGDYLVFATAAGFQSARRRVQRQAAEREFVVDLTLVSIVPQLLRAVQIQAGPPPRPARGAARLGSEETGASEQWVAGVAGALSPSQRGDLNALAGTIAGLTTGPGGASLLGADASSNLNTLNGAALPGGTLPRAAQLDARFVGATFDPTRGGFAGGQFELQLAAGDRLFQRRRAFLTLDPSWLQRTDAIGRAQGLTGQSVRASAGADGELIQQAMTYNVALDYARSTSSPATLLTADASTLQRAGVAADSARRLTALAPGIGLPLGGDATQRAETVTWLGRLDDTRDTSRVLALTNYLSWGRERGLGADARTSPGALAERTSQAGSLQLMHQHYVGASRTVYNENRIGISGSRRNGSPTLTLPAATVVVGGTAESGGDDVALLNLGGAPAANRDESSWTAEGASEWAWLARGTRHRFRAAIWGRGDGLDTQVRSNALGTFQFNSLGDLAANRAAVFTRTLNEPARVGTAWNGALAIAHRWAPSRRFQALYGLRAEGGVFATTPARNAAVEQAFGIRTDRAPARVALSPRAGFTWRPLPNRPVVTGIMSNEMGTFLQPSTNIIRGGIGVFRDLYRPTPIATAAATTGVPGSAVSIFCVGASSPTPTWSTYGSDGTIPNSCRDASSPLSQQSPAVVALDARYDVARSWRATLNWSGAIGIWQLRAEAVGARNLGSASTINHNFTNVTRFALANESRPMFVPITSIDPSTGVVSAAASRLNADYGSVRTIANDLESRGAQLTFHVTPDPLRTGGRFVSASYTMQTVRQQYRGFDGTSVGDPTLVSWARSASDARHAVLLQLGSQIPKVGLLTLFMRVQSGRPFTPIVQGDLDGDGTPGDRAYVASTGPSRPEEAQLAAGMMRLLDNAPSAVRACLTSQAGRIAARQSCEGPWTQAMNARLDVRLPSRLLGRRSSLSVNFTNPLGGLDQLLHGGNLRGWGTNAEPDPVLLVPRAFDVASRSFRYRVNPRFGDTRPANTLFRTPFRLSLDASFNLTRDEAAQNLDRSLDPVKIDGEWRRPPASSIVRRYEARISSVHSVILFNTDTLFLTRAQIEAFANADTVFRRDARAIYTALADSLAALPENFKTAAAVEMVKRADRRYESLFWQQRDLVKAQLTPVQSGALPEFLRALLSETLDADVERRPRYRFTSDGSTLSIVTR